MDEVNRSAQYCDELPPRSSLLLAYAPPGSQKLSRLIAVSRYEESHLVLLFRILPILVLMQHWLASLAYPKLSPSPSRTQVLACYEVSSRHVAFERPFSNSQALEILDPQASICSKRELLLCVSGQLHSNGDAARCRSNHTEPRLI